MSEKPNQDTALAVQPSSQLQSQSQQFNKLNYIEKLAQYFGDSGLYGIGKQAVAQCFIKILAGDRWGVDEFTAVSQIYIIQGKPCPSAHLIGAMIKRSKNYSYKIMKHTDETCLIHFFENKEFIGESEFSIKDAERAKLTGDKKLYGVYPKNMLYARAMSNGARWHCPDIFGGGVYSYEEMNEETNKNSENKDYIDTEVQEIKEDSAKKENFIISINKMNQVLVELGEPFIEENLNQLTLSQLKLSVDKISYRMKVLLISKLVEGLPHDQDLVNSLTSKSVVELYKMWQNLPKAKTGNTEQVIDAQVEIVE